MLNMLPSNDKTLLDELSYSLCSKPFSGAVGYIFYADGTPVGVAHLSVSAMSSIDFIGVLPAYRKKGYGDFFTRSILFRLSQISEKICIKYVSGYYNKFGFVSDGKNMYVDSDSLKFEPACGHC